MKFGTQFAIAALALGASAAHLQPVTHVVRSPPSHVERDLATVTSVIADVDSGIKALDQEVKGFSGDDSAMNKAAAALVSTLKSGASTVEGSDDLSLTDAVGLTPVVQGLQADSDVLVGDLKSKKSDFEEARLCSTVRQQTSDISNASKALIDAIVSKVPAAAQEIAKQLASGLIKSLEDAEATFAEGSCTDKEGGGGGDDGTTTTSGGDGGEGSTSAPAPTSTADDGGNGDGGAGYPTETSGPTTTDEGGSGYPTETPSGSGSGSGSYSGVPVPTPTGGNNGTTTGTQPTTTAPVPAGAAAMGVPLGAVLLAVAAALL